MGLVLTLLPIEGESGPDFAISHSALRVGDEDYDTFDDLLKLKSDDLEPVPKTFNTYLSRDGGGGVAPGEAHYGNTQTTPYGEKVIWRPGSHFASHWLFRARRCLRR